MTPNAKSEIGLACKDVLNWCMDLLERWVSETDQMSPCFINAEKVAALPPNPVGLQQPTTKWESTTLVSGPGFAASPTGNCTRKMKIKTKNRERPTLDLCEQNLGRSPERRELTPWQKRGLLAKSMESQMQVSSKCHPNTIATNFPTMPGPHHHSSVEISSRGLLASSDRISDICDENIACMDCCWLSM